MACYREGGCGPYEMYSCSACPWSQKVNAEKLNAAQNKQEKNLSRNELQWLIEEEISRQIYELVKNNSSTEFADILCRKQ